MIALIEQQLEFTRRIIGVDATCAERLLRRFQSVKRVMCATIEELLEDEDVGWMQIHHRWEMMTAPVTAQ
jgi:ERCC4-type nuclease